MIILQSSFNWYSKFNLLAQLNLSLRISCRYSDIVADDGELWTLVFPITESAIHDLVASPGSGPPYSLNFELIQSLLKPHGFQTKMVIKEEDGLPGHMSKRMPGFAKSMVVCWTR